MSRVWEWSGPKLGWGLGSGMGSVLEGVWWGSSRDLVWCMIGVWYDSGKGCLVRVRYESGTGLAGLLYLKRSRRNLVGVSYGIW